MLKANIIKEEIIHDNKITKDNCNADFSINNSQDIKRKSRNPTKEYNSEWISDCKNNELLYNSGTTVEKGWKIGFEQWEIYNHKVISMGGVSYTNGGKGYQITDLQWYVTRK